MMPPLPPDRRRIFVSVAEDSADAYAAAVVRAAAQTHPQWSFFGLTGPRLRDAGVQTVHDLTAHAAMLGGAVRLVGRAWAALRAVERCWRQSPPDAVLLLDSPELNLRLAARARRLGLPVLYYVAPQTWASREYRLRAIARDVTRLACILPFEEDYFASRGVNAEFVGHPLFELLAQQRPDPEKVQRLHGAGPPLLALLPGSRRHVIDAILPLQLAVVRELARLGIRAGCAVSAVDASRAAQIARLLNAHAASAEIVTDDNASLLAAADLALVASGTATLHVAHYRKPMIVLYDAGPLLGLLYRRLGHWVVRTPHLSLVNILAGARVVPEFMPARPDPARVARTAAALLKDEGWRGQIVRDLDALCRPLERPGAAARVCRMLDELLSREAPAARWLSRPEPAG